MFAGRLVNLVPDVVSRVFLDLEASVRVYESGPGWLGRTQDKPAVKVLEGHVPST